MSAPESSTPNIDYLLEHAEKLAALLREPEPGLFTWHSMVQRHIKAISDFHTAPQDS